MDDEQLYAEVFPAAIAIGLQPVRNIRDAATFECARREVVGIIESLDQPAVSYHLKLRLDDTSSPGATRIRWREAICRRMTSPVSSCPISVWRAS